MRWIFFGLNGLSKSFLFTKQFHMHFVLLRQAESQTRDVVSMRRDSTVQTQPESLRQTYQDMVDPIVDDSQPFQRSESPEEEILTRCSVGWCSGVADYTVEQESSLQVVISRKVICLLSKMCLPHPLPLRGP